MLESIPSDIITKAAAMLPDAKSTPDEPHNVAMLQGRRILITFRRFEYTRNNALVLDSHRRRAPTDKIMQRDKTLAEYFRG